MSLSKEEFLAPRKRRVESVDLPESGGTVHVRKLTVKEQIQLEAEFGALDSGDTEGFTAISLAFYLCTETGEPFISLAEARQHIGSRDATDVAAIMSKGLEMNRGLSKKAVENAKGN